MIAVALKGLAGRKVRALLTALPIVIGISMVSGTYILTDTMQKSFDGLFTATYDKTDAVITTKEIVKGSNGPRPIPAALLAKVQELPQVGAAGEAGVTPDEANAADILGRDGKAKRRSRERRRQLRPRSGASSARSSSSRASGARAGAGRDRRRHHRQAALQARRSRSRSRRSAQEGQGYELTGRVVVLRRRRLARLRQASRPGT